MRDVLHFASSGRRKLCRGVRETPLWCTPAQRSFLPFVTGTHIFFGCPRHPPSCATHVIGGGSCVTPCYSGKLIEVGTSSGGADPQADRLGPQCTAAVWGLPPRSGVRPRGLRCLSSPLFGCATHGAKLLVLCCALKLATGRLCSGASRDGLWCRPRSATTCDWPRLPGRSCGAACGWSWRCVGEATLRTEASRPPGSGPGEVRQKAEGTLRPATACQLSMRVSLKICPSANSQVLLQSSLQARPQPRDRPGSRAPQTTPGFLTLRNCEFTCVVLRP